ncbi:F-box associated domain-containing protein [Caenorhabditis elegans]|uniref:F-box associated domain-containing protein n=1 Tax=Caenorhabditis elegans TaxID=6239 RepID=A0A131MCU4_CAEEL|nr:F-box associated domain-containing protein [Caenorhabditis elegans]CZR14483.1 F-box associated domain-containing protein [Caenorhabditis elegans]|eukprot:NP_001309567.1 F-box B protein [Caenorhabditis elegans]
MATIPFSILRLPEPALHKSIKQMGLMEQFSLSVLSNKTKHAVTMLPAVKNRVSITMTSSLQLDISNEFQIVEFFFKMDPHYQSVEQRFSKQDLNLFMRQWINGAMPRLEVFHATFTHYDEHKLVETYLFKGIKYTVEDNKYSKIVEIERHDGVKASVCFDEQRSSAFCFSVESEPD